MRSLTFFWAFLLCLVPVTGWSFPAKIVHAVDGDTLRVERLHDGRKTGGRTAMLIRLYGVDSPEIRQAYGVEAAGQAHAFEGVTIGVEPYHTDKYGRTVAVLRLSDGTTLQEHLLRVGAAWVYPYFCKIPLCAKWRELETQARKERLGLWKTASPIPPWQWRKMNSLR